MAKITALSSLGWAHYTLYEALPRMKARGFRRVEVASFDTYCFHFNNNSPDPEELRATLKEMDLVPIGLNYCPRTYEAWCDEDIAQFERDVTGKLDHLCRAGIPMMTMLLGNRNDRPDQDDQIARVAAAYERVAEAAAVRGIKMLLELPHLYTILPRTEPVLRVLDRLQSPNVGLLVDSSHWGIIGYDLDAFFGAVGDRLWHVHLRDSRGPDTADRQQDLELTPGVGTVDFRAFGAALDRAGYTGDVSIEFEYRDMTLDAIEREYDAGLRHLSEAGWELPEGVRF
jgi:sugar phosphate isomerase/epimerase